MNEFTRMRCGHWCYINHTHFPSFLSSLLLTLVAKNSIKKLFFLVFNVPFLHNFYSIDIFDDFQRWAKSQLERHQEVVVLHETKSLSVDFVLHETIEICLVAEMGEKLTNIIHRPRMEGGSSGMSVGCGGREKERERERERGEEKGMILINRMELIA